MILSTSEKVHASVALGCFNAMLTLVAVLVTSVVVIFTPRSTVFKSTKLAVLRSKTLFYKNK